VIICGNTHTCKWNQVFLVKEVKILVSITGVGSRFMAIIGSVL